MLVIISDVYNRDRKLLPFELEKAVGINKMPVIMAYVGGYGENPLKKSDLWPKLLKFRIDSKSIKTIHVPFEIERIKKAIETYDIDNMPEDYITLM
ncbi:conserved hypothetical protein [Methanococcus maripaludis C5]|uniref:Uncharacterized protein n=1 Tax=Methanococcus maripaludis (strain C5 / ATCC BAA-1333) TaxID=402880 RepID=A4FZF7_METM5|nr:hypothetical protein [Methanococcus maripaludis]ABO35591.1 conserved hypothetical protein [Methanococcus maripaludis C5]